MDCRPCLRPSVNDVCKFLLTTFQSWWATLPCVPHSRSRLLTPQRPPQSAPDSVAGIILWLRHSGNSYIPSLSLHYTVLTTPQPQGKCTLEAAISTKIMLANYEMTNAFCKERSSSLPRQQGSYSTPVNPSDENSPQKLSQNLTLTCYLTCHNARHYGATNARAGGRGGAAAGCSVGTKHIDV